MTNEFQYLLFILGNSVQGKAIEWNGGSADWESLFRIAREQSVMPLLAYALKKNPQISCPEDAHDAAYKYMLSQAVNNRIRKEAILTLLEDMDKCGISSVLLKGYSVAAEYAAPDCRISADVDVLIAPQEEKRAYEYLASRGFAIQERSPRSHHGLCRHPQMGLIELHVVPYDYIVEDIWLKGKKHIIEPYLDVRDGEHRYYTLGRTDALIFLTMHLIKHFINSGMNLRSMFDVALYMKNHIEKIEWLRYWEVMKTCGFDEYIVLLLNVLCAYCGFDRKALPEHLALDVSIMDALLDDAEEGGCFGSKDGANRETGLYMYNRLKLIKDRSSVGYYWYMLCWYMAEWWRAMFPKYAYMKRNYNILQKHAWLLPFMWLHRLFARGVKRLKKGDMAKRLVTNEEREPETGRRRLELFRKLKLL